MKEEKIPKTEVRKDGRLNMDKEDELVEEWTKIYNRLKEKQLGLDQQAFVLAIAEKRG